MAARPDPLIVILGETASGKSALAMELAQRFNGEIICADSRTVYRGMDIGTAKPSKEDRLKVRHHLLDVVSPDQAFTAAEFKRIATEAIGAIISKGRLPVMVGGTGLYIDTVLFDFKFGPAANPKLRQELSGLSIEQLQDKLKQEGLALPFNERNPRHLIRVLETGGIISARRSLRLNTLVMGLERSKEDLRHRIEERVDVMIDSGLVNEAERLSKKYGWQAEALQTPGYKALKQYIEGEISLDEAKALFIKNDMDLAKRQRTWFRRNKSIQWVNGPSQAIDMVTMFLNTLAN